MNERPVATAADKHGERIRLLAESGKSDPEISKAVGVPPHMVFRVRKRLGIPSVWRREKAAHGQRAYGEGCRCAICKKANTDRCNKWKAKARSTGIPPGVKHGRVAYANWGCRCEICSRDQSAMNAARAALSIEETRLRNDASRARASKHGQEWTGPELEIALRVDLTSREAADLLGRTIDAVKGARKKLKFDPRTRKMVGLDPS